MTVLIGLTGLKGSGKDTAFGFIHEWALERDVLAGRRGFADSLKHSFARLFIPDAGRDEAVIWCDRMKNNNSFLTVREQIFDNGQVTTLEHQITMRTAFQRYGTETHREIFGDDFWVDQLLPTTFDENGNYTDDYAYNFQPSFSAIEPMGKPNVCVITDLRFENEANRIKELGGEIWKIDRPSVSDGDVHISEAGLPEEMIDVVIKNDGTFDMFRDTVCLQMTERHSIYLKGEK